LVLINIPHARRVVLESVIERSQRMPAFSPRQPFHRQRAVRTIPMYAHLAPCPRVRLPIHAIGLERRAPGLRVAAPQHAAGTTWVKGNYKAVGFFADKHAAFTVRTAHMPAHPLYG